MLAARMAGGAEEEKSNGVIKGRIGRVAELGNETAVCQHARVSRGLPDDV